MGKAAAPLGLFLPSVVCWGINDLTIQTSNCVCAHEDAFVWTSKIHLCGRVTNITNQVLAVTGLGDIPSPAAGCHVILGLI